MNRQLSGFVLFCLLASDTTPVWAQAPSESSASPQATPVLKATTRLVQINVVVHDKKGEPVEGLGLLHRVQVFAEKILYERQLQALGVGSLADDDRNSLDPRKLRRTPAALSHDDLIAISHSPYDQRLQEARVPKGIG